MHSLIKKMNFKLPEDLFDDMYPYGADNTYVKDLVVTDQLDFWYDLAGAIVSTKAKDKVLRKELTEEMGIVAITKTDNGFKVTINPSVYAAWWETTYSKREDPKRNTFNSMFFSEQPNVRENKKEEVKKPDDSIIKPIRQRRLKTKKIPPAETMETQVQETIPEFSKVNSKETKSSEGTLAAKLAKDKTSKPKTSKHDEEFLSLSKNQIASLANKYWDLSTGTNRSFSSDLLALQLQTNTQIRPIKKSESKYLKTNYMVNEGNVKEGLADLVAAKGRTTSPTLDKYYDVLTLDNKVVGHLVYYHNKKTNEITIPAVEVDLSCRGRHFALLFFLRVFQFAKTKGVTNIKLETGHHEKAAHLKEDLKRGMRMFYCKLGFRLESEKADDWNKKSLTEKVDSFKIDNEPCVFDSSPEATQLILDEAMRTMYAYQIKGELLKIVKAHISKLKTVHLDFSEAELLSYEPYRKWLINQIMDAQDDNLTMQKEYIDAALKILCYEYKSKLDLLGPQANKDYTELNKYIGHSPIVAENADGIVQKEKTDHPKKVLREEGDEDEDKPSYNPNKRSKIANNSVLFPQVNTLPQPEAETNNTALPGSNRGFGPQNNESMCE